MGLISKGKTWSDAENVNYSDLNGDFDTVYNEFNGNIDNDNIKSSAGISTSKISGTAVNLSSAQTITGIKTFTVATKPYLYANGTGSSFTINLNTANIHTLTLNAASVTINLSNASTGQVFILRLLQDTSGSRGTSMTWFSTIRWAGGTAPTLTTTASKADVFGFLCTGSGTYDGFVIGQNV